MTVKRTKPVSLEELWEFEAKHPVVFAALERTRQNRRRRTHRNGVARRRKAVTA